ncbi:MAG: helicase, partial [Parasphingopyxis sp.]
LDAGRPMPPLPPEGVAVLDEPTGRRQAVLREAGFRGFAGQMLRVDLAERVGRAAHDARDGKTPFAPDAELVTSLGLSEDALGKLMHALGFQRVNAQTGEAAQWVWRGRRGSAPRKTKPQPGNPFAELAKLKPHG